MRYQLSDDTTGDKNTQTCRGFCLANPLFCQILPVFLSSKWFQYTILKIVIKENPQNLGAQWIHNISDNFLFLQFLISDCVAYRVEIGSLCACIYVFSSNHCWKTRLFTYFNETTHSVGQPHTVSLSPLAFKGRGVHRHGLQPEYWSTFEPVACTLCLFICETLLVMPSSRDRLPPRPKGITSPQKSKPRGKKSAFAAQLESLSNAPMLPRCRWIEKHTLQWCLQGLSAACICNEAYLQC